MKSLHSTIVVIADILYICPLSNNFKIFSYYVEFQLEFIILTKNDGEH